MSPKHAAEFVTVPSPTDSHRRALKAVHLISIPKFFQLAVLLALNLVISGLAHAQQSFPMRELHVEGTSAIRGDDTTTIYMFLYQGWLRGLHAADADEQIERWIKAHPDAVVVPIGDSPFLQRGRLVYSWLEDGGDSLNEWIVAQGLFPASSMMDAVDVEQQTKRQLLNSTDPALAETKAILLRDFAAQTEADKPRRFIADADYEKRLARAALAEQTARAHKLGIWSDAMKVERDAEGLK